MADLLGKEHIYFSSKGPDRVYDFNILLDPEFYFYRSLHSYVRILKQLKWFCLKVVLYINYMTFFELTVLEIQLSGGRFCG
jgi:hypothetical protein